MLILTRRPREMIDLVIPPSPEPTKVTVTILGMIGNQVRIGFEAPKKVSVHRREVTERIRLEKTSKPQEGNGNVR